MIRVRVHPNYLLSHFVQGAMVAPTRVRQGVPPDCRLMDCRYDISTGYVYFAFDDGQETIKEMDVVFDVLAPVPLPDAGGSHPRRI